jgi:hypothetical protein
VIVRGPAGIGKTTTLDAIAQSADEYAVRRARGTPLEQGFALGVARQLLGLSEGGHAGDLPAVLHLLYLETADRASDGPLLLIVDDAHWADDLSLRFLAYLARRLEGLDVSLVVAVRTGDPGAEHEALVALGAEESTRTLTLGPLTPDEVAATFGHSADMAEAAHRATGGNPLLLAELFRTLDAQATPGDIARATVEHTVLQRLLPLGDAPRRFAEAAAVLGPGAPAHLAAKLAGLDEAAGAEARDALVRAEILDAERRLDFVHPLIAQAVTASLPPGRLAHDHGRAARLRDGAAAAAHLLEAEPAGDLWAVEVLREAARRALDDGGTTEASRLLRRALEEPPPPELRGVVLHEAGTAATRAGEADGTDLLRAALDHLATPEERVATYIELGLMLSIQGRWEEVEPLLPQLRVVADEATDPVTRAIAEARLAMIPMRHGRSVAEAIAWAQAFDRELEPRNPAERLLLGSLSEALLHAGAPAAEVVAAARAGIGDEAGYEEAIAWGMPLYPTLAMLVAVDAEEDLIEARLALALERAAERGSLVSRFLGVQLRSLLRVFQGRLADAEADLAEALALAEAGGRGYDTFQSAVARVEIALARDDLAAARQALADPVLARLTGDIAGWELRFRRAVVALAERDPRSALTEAEALRDEIDAAGSRIVPWGMWRLVAARAHRALGDEAKAGELAAEQLELARAFGAPATLGEALLLAAELAGDPLPLLDEAVSVTERSMRRLVHARARSSPRARRCGERTAVPTPASRSPPAASSRTRVGRRRSPIARARSSSPPAPARGASPAPAPTRSRRASAASHSSPRAARRTARSRRSCS